jgi:SAM-dependent methyltransferase
MDNAIIRIFDKALNIDLLQSIISNSADKDRITKVKIRPVVIKKELLYQASEYIGQQIFHCNYRKEELIAKLPDWFDGVFHQAEIATRKGNATVLISKKGKVTVIDKLAKASNPDPFSDGVSSPEERELLHNKKKKYILTEGEPLPFLIDLGVMTGDGTIVKSKSDKFRQINRFLEYIEDVLPFLNQEKELTILDFGCGKSYLTFAMYYYLKLLKGYRINVIGLDLKTEVIRKCNELSKKYGYDKLNFMEGDIATYQGSSEIDMVVTLHACDTATDYALYKAVNWGAQVILSVPCCQHELNRQLQNDILKPVLKYGIVKERLSALITDALRAELLEAQGYKVQLLEFIDMEHTPKNILIRAVKRSKAERETAEYPKELRECMEFLKAEPCLLRLFESGAEKE